MRYAAGSMCASQLVALFSGSVCVGDGMGTSMKQKSEISLRVNSNDLTSSDGYYTYTLNRDEAPVTGYNDNDINIIVLSGAIDGIN